MSGLTIRQTRRRQTDREADDENATVSGESVSLSTEIEAQTEAERITLVLSLEQKLEFMVSGYEDITKMVRFFPGEAHLGKADEAGELPVVHDSLMTLRDTISELYPDLPTDGNCRLMMNHTCYPKISAELEPSFMSYSIVTSLLREELGFTGVIYTPPLSDPQLSARYIVDSDVHLAVDAIKAGCDVIYQPHDKKAVIAALEDEVASGRIEEDRINASVVRIIEYRLLTGEDIQRYDE